MPKRTPYDDLSTLASAVAAAKSAQNLLRSGLDDGATRAMRESHTARAALAAARGTSIDVLGSQSSGLSTIDAAAARAADTIAEALGGSAARKAPVAEATARLHNSSALDSSKLLATQTVIPDTVGKALKEIQTMSGLGSVTDILGRDGIGRAYSQLGYPGVISPHDYASPMRSVFDELGGSLAPSPARPSVARTKALPDMSSAQPTHGIRGARAAVPSAAGTSITVAEIGERVRAERKAMGMTQQRFADLAGVGRRFLIELEQGKPSLEIGRVLAVCHAAGIKLGFVA